MTLKALGLISYVLTRPTLCDMTMPPSSSTLRCFNAEGSRIPAGSASCLTEAGRAHRRSTIALRPGSARAVNTRSSDAASNAVSLVHLKLKEAVRHRVPIGKHGKVGPRLSQRPPHRRTFQKVLEIAAQLRLVLAEGMHD